MLVIGIDPGISGAICFLENGKVIDVIDMPNMAEGKKNKRQVNGAQIFNEINNKIKNSTINEVMVVIEHVSAMPGQGVTSMFNFGQSFGVIKGICAAMRLPLHLVRPVRWKKYFNLINSENKQAELELLSFFQKYLINYQKKKISIKQMQF